MLVTHRTTDFEWKRTVLWRWVITGYGTINGRLVYIFAQDFTVLEVLYLKLMLRKSAKSWIW
jgi:propionyl-CoA carboxylase beta chain